jgi:hypothetical protein
VGVIGMQLGPLNAALSLVLQGLTTVGDYIPSKKARIGRQLRKLIDNLEDIIERANLIIDRLRDIEHSRDYIVKDVYTSFYEQIKALEKLSRLLDKSEIF